MGSHATPRVIGWRAALTLGRVSNLPTVWSNVIAGAMLAGGTSLDVMLTAMVAMSLLYVGGMYLNDAFDREIDARERASRPIPAGDVSPRMVFAIGLGLLAAGVVGLVAVKWQAGAAGLILAGAIVLYDWHHKGNRLGPLLMGFCRAMVYVGTAAAATAMVDPPVLIGALVLMLYVAGITLAAKQEALERPSNWGPLLLLAAPLAAALLSHPSSWPVALASIMLLCVLGYAVMLLRRRGAHDVGRAVGVLIAAIALVDALAVASVGALPALATCVVLFLLTLLLQRYVPGT